jgi:hypothetical protein
MDGDVTRAPLYRRDINDKDLNKEAGCVKRLKDVFKTHLILRVLNVRVLTSFL